MTPAPESPLEFAQQLADAARPIALRHFRRPLQVDWKSDASPVTVADREIETELRELIRARFPEHGILGEEFGAQRGGEYTWVVDPIDGTRSFISGMPLFGTLIALLQGAAPVLGLIDMPALDERWLGHAGMPTRRNGVDARCSSCTRLAQARIYTTSPDTFDGGDWNRYDALSRRAAVRRYGGDCYSYGLLASGHCELVVEAGLQPYDYLALVPVVEGAGGRISDWNGAPLGRDSDGRVIAAANAVLWQLALESLR
jgi:myo-inositol-1(or 4)-monophosphatase